MTGLPRKTFRPSSYSNTVGARYRAQLQRHPFALFGLPFIVTMVAGSFFLTPATAIRYERHDRKVRRMTREEELNLGGNRRQVDMKEEYYVRHLTSLSSPSRLLSRLRSDVVSREKPWS